MRVTKRQLRRIIREAQWGNFTGGAAPLDEPPMDSGPMTPEMQQRVFDILVDSGSDPQELKASGDYPDLMLDEAEGSTKKYDDDSALRGKQSTLPDSLQRGIIDKSVEDREEREEEEGEEKNESVRITRHQLRRIIKEELLNEQTPAGAGHRNPLNALVAAVQDLVDDGVSLFDFQERLPSYGFDDSEVATSPISIVMVYVNGEKYAIVPASAASQPDAVVGKYAIGLME